MRIAQLAPLWESVPPPAYGGTELIVGLLTEELVRRGHEVTLFASGDSQTLAKLQPGCDAALRPLGSTSQEYTVQEQGQLSRVFTSTQKFDIIHSHVDFVAFPYADLVKTPVVHTLHSPLVSTVERVFMQHAHQNFVSISNAQRRPQLGINYVATVYNAIATDQFTFYSQAADPPYLAFLGRMSPDKGPHLAIEIAKRAGLPLKMAGKVDPVDQDFFEQEVAPYIDGQQIEFLGEANHEQKNHLMGEATAFLFPITWPEPFGLVMAESMACGTPVIAMALGSAPELIVEGQTGFLGHTVEDCVIAIAKIPSLNRQICRDHVLKHFNLHRMVDDYERVYCNLVAQRFTKNGYSHPPMSLAS